MRRGLVLTVLAVAVLVTLAGPAAARVADDCGGGTVRLVQADDDPTAVVGVRVAGIGAACEGQPVTVRFLGNAAGDPALPATEVAAASSDVDPCTGALRPDGVLRDGAVEVLVCPGARVDGRRLTGLRLVTPAGAITPTRPPLPVPDPGAPPAAPEEPTATPTPTDDLPVTGADVLRALVLGATLVTVGSTMVRAGRRRTVGPRVVP